MQAKPHLHAGQQPLHGGDEAAEGPRTGVQVQLLDEDFCGVGLDDIPAQVLFLGHLKQPQVQI